MKKPTPGGAHPPKASAMKILVLDVGGTHVKLALQGKRELLKLPSGPDLTPGRMVTEVLEATKEWTFDHVSIGVPAPVNAGKLEREPFNLGEGWVEFNFQRALGNRPVKLINDAAMQALGSYDGGRMLFL